MKAIGIGLQLKNKFIKQSLKRIMVLKQHRKFYEEIFKIPGFLSDPFLMFGLQEISKDFAGMITFNTFEQYLRFKGVQDITILEYDDERADVNFDMNFPFDQNTNQLINAFKVVCDIGCLEHVFNSAQAMKNCLEAVEEGGLYFLHTPVSGYFMHGFHTFNPEMLKWVLKNNGFEIEYCKYSTKKGEEVKTLEWGSHDDILIWLVGRKVKQMDKFHMPVQFKQDIFESYRTK